MIPDRWFFGWRLAPWLPVAWLAAIALGITVSALILGAVRA